MGYVGMLCYSRRLGSGLRKFPKDDYGPGKDGFLKPERIACWMDRRSFWRCRCSFARRRLSMSRALAARKDIENCRGVIAVCDKPAVLDGTFRK